MAKIVNSQDERTKAFLDILANENRSWQYEYNLEVAFFIQDSNSMKRFKISWFQNIDDYFYVNHDHEKLLKAYENEMLWLRVTFCKKKHRVWRFHTFWLQKTMNLIPPIMAFETKRTIHKDKKLCCIEHEGENQEVFRNGGNGLFSLDFDFDNMSDSLVDVINEIFEN